jgi:hypothetical protein
MIVRNNPLFSAFAPFCTSPNIANAILGEVGGGSFHHNSSFGSKLQDRQRTLRKPPTPPFILAVEFCNTLCEADRVK